MSSSLFQQNILLSELCTFGIGGPARFFIEVRSVEKMQETLKICHTEGLPFMILGKGSNCLFDDRGFNGVVILNKIDFLQHLAPHTFHTGAGYSFSLLGSQTARQGFSGLEFASGIPGSVGGAVFMNAGANGCETCTCLTSVDFVSEEGVLHMLTKQELSFSYRKSSFHEMSGAIVGATFELSSSSTARQRQIEIIDYRKKTQPLRDKSAGCVFRNPTCGHAGALIEKSGLKGVLVGGAKVSEVHANFIVNADHASAQDVLHLISVIKAKVQEKTGVELENELRCIQYDNN